MTPTTAIITVAIVLVIGASLVAYVVWKSRIWSNDLKRQNKEHLFNEEDMYE